MTEINKLNPPGLLELTGLLALVKRLIAMVADFGEADAASVRFARIINQNLKRLREGYDFNTNLRIRYWVLQTAERRAWARRIIGEGRIARWQQDYDALARHELPASRTQTGQASAQPKTSTKPAKPRKSYIRKPFTLPRLADLFVMPFDFCTGAAFKPYVLRTSPPYQGYKTPGRKPVVFWPRELTPDYTPDPKPEPESGQVSTTVTDENGIEPATGSETSQDPPNSGDHPDPKPP